MAKVSDLKITIVPELDVGKTQEMAKKFGNIFKKSTKMMSNIRNTSGKAIKTANQGLQLLEQIKNVLNKTLGTVTNLMNKGDSIADLASMGNISEGQVHSLISGLKSGSSSENTLQLFETFLQKSSEDNISFKNAKGEDITSIDYFVSILEELSQRKTIQESSSKNAKEKELARQEEQAMIEHYFGIKKSKMLQDAINSVKDFHKNKLSQETQTQMTVSAHMSDHATATISKNQISSEIRQNMQMLEKNIHAVPVINEMLENIKHEAQINNSTVESILKGNQMIMKIETCIEQLVGSSVDILSSVKGIFTMVTTITNLLQKLTSSLSLFRNKDKTTEQMKAEKVHIIAEIKKSINEVEKKYHDKSLSGKKMDTINEKLTKKFYQWKDIHNELNSNNFLETDEELWNHFMTEMNT